MVGIGVLVFLARLLDVSLGTVKLKCVMRGNKNQAFVISFIEVIVYTLAASQAFKYVDNPVVLILYALGYASGSYIGIIIDEKLSKGTIMVNIIKDFDNWELADKLREQGYGVTTSKGYGLNGSGKVQLTVLIDKNKIKELHKMVKEHDDNAYIVNMDVKNVMCRSSVRK